MGRGISKGGILSIARLVEEKAPPVKRYLLKNLKGGLNLKTS